MNRRYFLELLAKVAAVSTVAYSFPRVIVPRNVYVPGAAWVHNPVASGVTYIVNNSGFYLPVYTRQLPVVAARVLFPEITTTKGNP